MYTSYVFTPAPRTALAVRGSADRFAVRRIYCIGRNYADHVREMGGDPSRESPIFFSKPADAIAGAGGVVAYPPGTTDLHHEVELVVAIQRGGANIPADEALNHVWGYAVGNDLTRRDLQAQARTKGQPWDMSKGFDASAQIGVLTPASEFGEPSTQAIWLKVNGQTRQQSTLDKMIWSVPEIIAALSQLVTLQVGDLIFTGTPEGVSALTPGDEVTAGIEGLDPIEFRIGPPA
ncbi:MAG: fumarylacetoacetate hydrolase family protein [Nevskiaceae bacterium]|jgi:fumarylpyruvate hydrolase|nr:fumarylacetoacetate hydrolase family protein [Nevskiaceae bacterium]